MTEIYRQHINTKHTNTTRYGGYITYWKLMVQMFTMCKSLPTYERYHTYVTMLIKSPWYLLIKPLGCLFKTKTIKAGEIQLWNNRLKTHSVKKRVIMYFMCIPFLAYNSKITEEEVISLV